jgi:acetoin utilization deacetylase AcuC-like enzyme
MITFFSAQHERHAPRYEFFRGERVPCFETPSRADIVHKEVAARGHRVCAPTSDSRDLLARIHAPRYLSFLESAWTSGWRSIRPMPLPSPSRPYGLSARCAMTWSL